MAIYDEIMERLNPKVIISVVDEPHDTARGSYVLRSSIAHSYQEFEGIIVHYTDHHMKMIFGNSLPNDHLLQKSRNFLESDGSFKNAAFMGLSGTEGGMIQVLNMIAEGFKAEAKKAYFDYILDSFIDPLSFEQVVRVMKELKTRLSSYSSDSFDYISPEAMAADYKEIIWKYIDALTRYRNLWQY